MLVIKGLMWHQQSRFWLIMLRNLTIFFLSKSVYLVQTPILLMIDAKMFSLPWKRLFKKFATISLQVVIIFLTNSVTIATTKTLEFSLIYMYLKDKRDDHHTLTPVCIVQRFRFFVRFFFLCLRTTVAKLSQLSYFLQASLQCRRLIRAS